MFGGGNRFVGSCLALLSFLLFFLAFRGADNRRTRVKPVPIKHRARPEPTNLFLKRFPSSFPGRTERLRVSLGHSARNSRLYLEGKIDQWYSLQDRKGVAFILNITNPAAAHEMLEKLPLGQAHMSFELIPLGPLNPLRKLPGMSAQPQ